MYSDTVFQNYEKAKQLKDLDSQATDCWNHSEYVLRIKSRSQSPLPLPTPITPKFLVVYGLSVTIMLHGIGQPPCVRQHLPSCVVQCGRTTVDSVRSVVLYGRNTQDITLIDEGV